ncbi:MAG: hypothetical protein KGJ80_17565, partial [Chloroflexota bacterium]|nr:hypothetical protein [Chloroflexota bacterium]
DTPNSLLRPSGVRFGESITLLGYAPIPSRTIQGGETLRLIVEWRANQDIRNRYVILAHVFDDRGHLWARDDREPARGFTPTDRWKAGDIVRDEHTFDLPRTMPPGDYQIIVGIWDPTSGISLEARDRQDKDLGVRVALGSIQVTKDHTSIPASFLAIEHPLYVDMGEIRLIGFAPLPQTVAPGEGMQIGLYWRAREKPRDDYAVSVQLRDAEGRVAFEQTERPAAGSYPTTLWSAGEVLLDWHDLSVPSSLAPGKYNLTVVLLSEKDRRVLGEASIGQMSVGN